MQAERTEIGPDSRRQTLISRLNSYLEASRETILREHQMDVVESLRDFLSSGERAGYISLPTGSGKTVLITELANMFGIKTLVLSPTITILKQTAKASKDISKGVEFANFYTGEKDTSGQVINTTYQSIDKLIASGQIDPSEFELVLADEAHTGLGEKRHTIFRHFPNATLVGLTATPYFTPLEGYKRRGIVKANEQWTGLFERCIHEMTIEESIERGILCDLDVHLIQTNTHVEDIEVVSQDRYKQADLDRYFNTLSRNYLTVGMVVGLDKVPGDIQFTEEQKVEIAKIHEKIEGKRTAIFGINIGHVEKLKEMLQESGVESVAIHSNISPDKREEIMRDYSNGNYQVILGVDMLRLGWDSPATEVGIYLAPTLSGIVATQELGRILRNSPVTGKTKAIAVQLVDDFSKRKQAPVVIPNIFDPYYVLRGSQVGAEKSVSGGTSKREELKITFSGMNLEAVLEESRASELLRTRFKQASLKEINETLDKIVIEAVLENQGMPTLDLYKAVADNLPWHVISDIQNKLLQGIASLDSNTVELSRRLLVFLYLKSIISAVEYFEETDHERIEEMTSLAVIGALEALSFLKTTTNISQQIYSVARRKIAADIAQIENVPQTWVEDRRYVEIKKRVGELIETLGVKRIKHEWDEVVNKLVGEFEVSSSSLDKYLLYRLTFYEKPVGSTTADELALEVANNNELAQALEKALTKIVPREAAIISSYFELGSRKFSDVGLHNEVTLETIGRELHLTRERIRGIMALGLRRMRQPLVSKPLRVFLTPHKTLFTAQRDEIPHTRIEPANPKGVSQERIKSILKLLRINTKSKLVAVVLPAWNGYSGSRAHLPIVFHNLSAAEIRQLRKEAKSFLRTVHADEVLQRV